jgi:hypothetical protein
MDLDLQVCLTVLWTLTVPSQHKTEEESNMSTWWLAISKKHTSYNELKHRKVIAQGWPDLGDLRTLCPLVEAPLFRQSIH